MKLKTFSLVIDEQGRIDDQEMQDELEDCEVIEVWQQFLLSERVWLVMVAYRPSFSDKAQKKERKKSKPERKKDYKRTRDELTKNLDAVEQVVFESLRSWRKLYATESQRGVHFILTNAQLVELVKLKPQSLSDLEPVKGIGKGKIKEFGLSLIEASQQAWIDAEKDL